jgi:acetamidase/formamidase
MPLDQPGIQSTFPPTRCGGNLDCRELTEGTALFLPIAVDDGLFSTGDGHAVQGDGEVAFCAEFGFISH